MPSSPWATSGTGAAAAATGVPVGSQASVEAAQVTANTALAATIAAGSDGILSKGEKPGVVIDFQGATANHTMLVAKAMSCGVRYDDFSASYGALRDYLQGLSPAYTSTTTDTPINAASWAAVWNAWGAAYTDMLVRIAAAAPSTVDGIAAANVNITTNAAAPVVDGVSMAAGKAVLLPFQTTKSQNGVYVVIFTPATGAPYNMFPTTSTTGGNGGIVIAPANAYDITTGTTPNNTTYTTLSSGSERGNTGEVVFSGFSGTNLTGDITIKLTPECDVWGELGEARPTILVQTSIDSGVSWDTVATFTMTGTMQTITVPVFAITGSTLRVRVRAQAAAEMAFDQNHEYVVVGILAATAKIHSVYLAIPVTGVANWSLVKQASIPNASVWRTRGGSTRGPGSHYLATVATDNGVTLTTQEAPYEAPLGKPGSGAAFLKRDSGGGTSWEARRYGFPNYAAGATRALTTVYQAAEDGWLNLVLVGSYINDAYVYVGSTNNPATLIWRAGDDINVNTKYASGMLPIPAGTYYKVVSGTYGWETSTLKWFPALT